MPRLAKLLETKESEVRNSRHKHGIRPVYKRIDSCAAEFASDTAYLYSTYEQECEARIRLIAKKSLFWVAVRTVSVKGSSLIIVVYMPRWRCGRMVMKPS